MQKIYYNTTVASDQLTLNNLINSNDIIFTELLKDTWYLYTDSDIQLIDDVPHDFVDHLIEMCIKYDKHKIGLGLITEDITQSNYTQGKYWELIEFMKNYESQFATEGGPYNIRKIESSDNKCILYEAPIDTTLAIYKPNSAAIGTINALRTGYPYISRHLPFYYDISSYPEDELYYLKHMASTAVTGFSNKVLELL